MGAATSPPHGTPVSTSPLHPSSHVSCPPVCPSSPSMLGCQGDALPALKTPEQDPCNSPHT